MPIVSPYLAKALLDWTCGGGTPTRPPARYLGLLDPAGSELWSVTNYGRRSPALDGCASPVIYVSMTLPCTFETLGNSVVIAGVALFDASSAGNMLFSGSLMTARSINANDTFVAAELSITLT